MSYKTFAQNWFTENQKHNNITY